MKSNQLSTQNNQPSLDQVIQLINDAYIPFVDIERDMPWPTQPSRKENDAEHSFSVALTAAAVAERIGLDAGKASQFGLVHDLVERFAGDTSIWDHEGLKTKAQREQKALYKIDKQWAGFPWIAQTIRQYEQKDCPESVLVYAIDKIIPLVMHYLSRGYYWQKQSINYKEFQQKTTQIRQKVAEQPVVLGWFDEMILRIKQDKSQLFTN